MDIRPVEGRAANKLTEAAPRKDTPAAKASNAALPKPGDSVEISDVAREAEKISRWAQAVRNLPAVRKDALADAAATLNDGSLLGPTACRAAAVSMRQAMAG